MRTSLHTREGGRPADHASPSAPLRARLRAPSGFTVFLLCSLLFAGVAVALAVGTLAAPDRRTELLVHTTAPGDWHGLMTALSLLGSTGSIAVLALVCAAYFLQRRLTWASAFVVACPAGAGVMDTVLKHLFQRQRPHLWPHAAIINSYSFPSGHATISSAFFAGVCLTVWRLWGPRIGSLVAVVAVVLVGGIGLSRIYLGVHWPSDVIAGYALGLAWVALLLVLAGSRGRSTPAPGWSGH